MTCKRIFKSLKLGLAITVLSIAMQSPAIADLNETIGLNNEGVKALNVDNYELALQKFLDALKSDINYELARENLAIVYAKLASRANDVEALSLLHKALLLNSRNSIRLDQINKLISKQGKDPNAFVERMELAAKLMNQNDLVGAFVELLEAEKLDRTKNLRPELVSVAKKMEAQKLFPFADLAKRLVIVEIQKPTNELVTEKFQNTFKKAQMERFMYRVESAINRYWNPPAENIPRFTVIDFKISWSGFAKDIRLVETSGSEFADAAAIEAVRGASPFVKTFGLSPLPFDREIDVHFSFDYKYKGVSAKKNRETTKFGVIKDLCPPTDFELAELKRLEQVYLRSSRETAGKYEQFGDFESARTIYHRIGLILQSQKVRNHDEEIQNLADQERVAFFRVASAMRNAEEFRKHFVAWTPKIILDETLTTYVRTGLQQQLVDDAVVCKCDFLELSNDVSKMDISNDSKYLCTSLLKNAGAKAGESVVRLGLLQDKMNKYRKTSRELSQADEISRRAVKLEVREEYEKALGEYRNASVLTEKICGKEGEETLLLDADIARVLAKQGKLGEAEKKFEKILATFRKKERTDYRFVRVLEIYGDVLHRANKPEKASAIYAEAVLARGK